MPWNGSLLIVHSNKWYLLRSFVEHELLTGRLAEEITTVTVNIRSVAAAKAYVTALALAMITTDAIRAFLLSSSASMESLADDCVDGVSGEDSGGAFAAATVPVIVDVVSATAALRDVVSQCRSLVVNGGYGRDAVMARCRTLTVGLKPLLVKEFDVAMAAVGWETMQPPGAEPATGAAGGASGTSSVIVPAVTLGNVGGISQFTNLAAALVWLQFSEENCLQAVPSAAPVRRHWAIDSLAKPLLERFQFHFQSARPTNCPDKPEWFLHYVLNVVRSRVSLLLDRPSRAAVCCRQAAA